MTTCLAGTCPILSCDEARALESALFGADEAREWPAMQRAGRALAGAVLRDSAEMGGFPASARLLVLAGKGHNGGDAMIAAGDILRLFPAAEADVVFAFGSRALRPLAARAWQELVQSAGSRVRSRPRLAPAPSYDLALDGVFGFQFRPPVTPDVVALLERVNSLPIRLRAAVDLPSAGVFQADFTYATGSVKAPAVADSKSGRIRYLDLGFFPGPADGGQRVLTNRLLAPLLALRSPQTDKRTFGHVFIMGGSRTFPGAALMSVLAALRSGAGLVTAFVPESLAGVFAARAPEAMWVGWPETPAGGLALEGEHLLRERIERASALVIGPGLGRDPETRALVTSIVQSATVPLVLDADALQPETVRAGQAPRILTPHAGEFARIGGDTDVNAFAASVPATVVLKGSVTRIAGGIGPGRTAGQKVPAKLSRPVTYHSFFGGPVLARGGSGDLLAGLIGGLLAQTPTFPLLAAARGVVWHGCAADSLARAHGQTSVSVVQLLDFLGAALKESAHDP